MKLLVKTLKGGKFPIEAEESTTVEAVKGIIETANAELPAASMKLIHSGKVLKDEDVLSTVGIKEGDFLVVMITKKKATPKTPEPKKEEAKTTEKAAATPVPAAAAAPAATASTTSAATAAAPSSTTTTPAPAATTATTPAPSSTTTTTPAAPAQPPISDAAVENLTGMGFPEEAVRHCLRVAQGNPDLAVEFLTNGIPEGMEQAMQAAASRSSAATPASGGGSSSNSSQPLQALRNHPQFNALRRLVQSNPQMLQQVLTQIGQQQPELLQEINANQALFLQMMNEPIEESSGSSSSTSSAAPTAGSSSAPADNNPFGGGMGNPMQMAQMIQSMNPDELNQMAQMMGVSPEQLRTTAQMIGQMPPEQLNQFIMQAMGGGEGIFGGGGAGGGGGGGAGGPQVLRLTDEEMAAVDRLTEMGFDRAEAAQAFLACDKNEALAANLLMDSMMDGGGDAGGSNQGGGGSGGGNNNNNNGGGDDDEDMYD